MRNQVWNAAPAQLYPLDLAELVLGLFTGDAVNSEAALGVVDQAEVLSSLLDRDDVLEAGWVGGVGADFAIDLDEALHDNCLGLPSIQRILQAVAKKDDKRQTVTQFVRTGRCLGGIAAGEFVEQPVRWRAETLLMLLPRGMSVTARC